MRRVVLPLLVAAVLAAGGCSSVEAPSSTDPSSATDAVVADLARLPAIDLDTLPTPRRVPGFSDADMRAYARPVRDLVSSSVLDPRWWDAEPTTATTRRFLADLDPRTRREYLRSVQRRSDSLPSTQYLVSIFDADQQPVASPRIVKAAWRTQRGRRADGSPFQRVALQVVVLYRVGPRDRPLPVVVARWFQLSGSPGAGDSWPSLAHYTVVQGVDECTLYEDGRYEATSGGLADLGSLRGFLEAARDRGWTDFGRDDDQDDAPRDKQDAACSDRSAS